jgi:folate-binding protein YgfZ
MQNLADLPFIDDAARDRLTVEGDDALTYLQSQIAQEIRDMEVGETRWTLVLEPTGKVEVLARITRASETSFVLDTDAGFGEAMETRINRFKIRVKAVSTLELADQIEPSAKHEAARVAAGWPRMGAEIFPGQTIPAVTGVVPLSVNFTKGCYPGQELVERMESRGADAPKSLRIIEVPEGTAVGATIDDGAEVTSVNGTTALAYVKRGNELGTAPAHTA